MHKKPTWALNVQVRVHAFVWNLCLYFVLMTLTVFDFVWDNMCPLGDKKVMSWLQSLPLLSSLHSFSRSLVLRFLCLLFSPLLVLDLLCLLSNIQSNCTDRPNSCHNFLLLCLAIFALLLFTVAAFTIVRSLYRRFPLRGWNPSWNFTLRVAK